jgi:Protein of unknown function (DUF2442)
MDIEAMKTELASLDHSGGGDQKIRVLAVRLLRAVEESHRSQTTDTEWFRRYVLEKAKRWAGDTELAEQGWPMALIKAFEEKRRDRQSVHDGIDATYSVFERNRRIFVQIDTYGRAEREMPGKISQSLQFDEKSARELFDVLRDAFRFRWCVLGERAAEAASWRMELQQRLFPLFARSRSFRFLRAWHEHFRDVHTLDDASMSVELSDGRTIGVPFAWFPRLLCATPEQCDRVEIGRIGLHREGGAWWPDALRETGKKTGWTGGFENLRGMRIAASRDSGIW